MSFAQVGLTINVGSDPIEGCLTTGSGQTQPFHGWVELASAIEVVRAATTDAHRGADSGSSQA